ncbi:MAG: 2Fe-2S iron-sulfur cluster-binding protein [Ignavibacteriaceae bacterium]
MEGLSSINFTHIQNDFIKEGASQCGFCTPGFIVSLTGYLINHKVYEIDQALNSIAGNIINASPIGDLTIFFLALNASVVINDGIKQRKIFLKNLYKGYKNLDKADNEYLEYIEFKLPSKKFYFNFEKVSKRTHLDIASVNSAMYVEVEDNIIKSICISAGGVSPIPLYLEKTSKFLFGKQISENTIIEALPIIQSEISPISDVRGSENYKRLLINQLFKAHFMEFFPEDNRPQLKCRQNLLHLYTHLVFDFLF